MNVSSLKTGFLSAALGLASFVPTGAAAIVFTANLTHDQEVSTGTFLTSTGDPRPLSYGTATLTLNQVMVGSVLTFTDLEFTATVYNIDFTGLQTPGDANDDLRAAHIHRAPVGTGGPVVFGFFGAPFNDIAPMDLVVTPFASNLVGGTVYSKWDLGEGQNTTLVAELPHLLNGNLYLNFHTTQFPGGEIRGQIEQVPEAGSATLWLGAALAGMLGLRRRLARRHGC